MDDRAGDRGFHRGVFAVNSMRPRRAAIRESGAGHGAKCPVGIPECVLHLYLGKVGQKDV